MLGPKMRGQFYTDRSQSKATFFHLSGLAGRVVDWSLSFFTTLESSKGTIGPSLRKSSNKSLETFKRYLEDIALRSISVNIGSQSRR